MTSSTASVSSLDSARRSTALVSPQPPASRTGSGCAWICRATPPCSAVQTEKPSSVLTPAIERVRPIARPSGQPFGSPSISGSAPVRSSNAAIT